MDNPFFDLPLSLNLGDVLSPSTSASASNLQNLQKLKNRIRSNSANPPKNATPNPTLNSLERSQTTDATNNNNNNNNNSSNNSNLNPRVIPKRPQSTRATKTKNKSHFLKANEEYEKANENANAKNVKNPKLQMKRSSLDNISINLNKTQNQTQTQNITLNINNNNNNNNNILKTQQQTIKNNKAMNPRGSFNRHKNRSKSQYTGLLQNNENNNEISVAGMDGNRDSLIGAGRKTLRRYSVSKENNVKFCTICHTEFSIFNQQLSCIMWYVSILYFIFFFL